MSYYLVIQMIEYNKRHKMCILIAHSLNYKGNRLYENVRER